MKNASYQRKLFRDFLLVGILPLVFCVSLIFVVFHTSALNSAEKNGLAQLERMTDSFGRMTAACDAVLVRTGEDPAVVAALQEGAARDTRVYTSLYALAAPLLGRADFSLYDAQGRLLYTTGGARPGEDLPVNWGLLSLARERGGLVCRKVSPYDAVSRGVLQLARAVVGRAGTVGYAVAELTQEQVGALFGESLEEGSEMLLLDPFWEEAYASPGLRGSDLSAQLRTALLTGSGAAEDAGEADYYARREALSGFALILRQPKPLADWVIRMLYFIAGLFILVSAVLCLRVAVSFSRRIFEPIRSLNGAMAQVERGDLDVTLPVHGTDEISQLAGRFNRMTGRLKENLAQTVRQQQELGDAQIRMMQAQLNPHFLYNTLDTLKWLGKINKVEEVSTISADLADILRSSITAEEFVPLSQELALLERYAEIQKIRFPGKFEYVTQVEAEVLELPVPKLMLQPLVENAIIHGFEDGSHGSVRVEAHRQGDDLVITVRDDGVGMSPESARRFADQRGPEEGTGHFGLFNVDAILRLHYGQDRGLKLIPTEKGTCIRAVLPIREEEKP